ncbi:MAG TPA: CBS domain-containing protein [Blastocatellia bacterium]|jgi:CBS domain-containing protein|nr:CBS domain-containing protein [Blastocatellia bacterium]
MARYYDVDYEPAIRRGRYEGARGFIRRAGDEVRSWFGDEEADRRRGRDDYEYERRGRQGDYWRPRYSIDDMRASDLMSRNVFTVYPEDRVGYAARLMRDYDCGALPVVDQEGRLMGILTDRDISLRLVANEADTHNTVVADFMTDGAYACHADDPIRECMRQMSRYQVRRLPIIDDWGHVIGIVSQGDLARHAGNYPGRGERRAIADVVCAISEPRRAARR